MHVLLRFPLLPGVLLLAAASFARAESPMPEPIAPAVVGRPLEQARPARALRQKAARARPVRSRHAAARPAAVTRVARQPAPAATARAPGPGQHASTQRAARQALDDRADPRMRLDDVGKGTHFARKPLAAGAYIGEQHRSAVRKYYEQHPAPGAGAAWKIGEPVPRGVPLAPVPEAVMASLPKVPPGHRYVQLGGEVVLIAARSRMVVDGIAR